MIGDATNSSFNHSHLLEDILSAENNVMGKCRLGRICELIFIFRENDLVGHSKGLSGLHVVHGPQAGNP